MIRDTSLLEEYPFKGTFYRIEVDKSVPLAEDLLYVAFFSPAETASMTKKHGTFAITIGSQYITSRGALWRMMKRLYDKWGEEDKLGDTNEGGLQWME